jgi:hypothetical protein
MHSVFSLCAKLHAQLILFAVIILTKLGIKYKLQSSSYNFLHSWPLPPSWVQIFSSVLDSRMSLTIAFLQMKDHISIYIKHVILQYRQWTYNPWYGSDSCLCFHSLGNPFPIFSLYGNDSAISVWQIVQILLILLQTAKL